VYELAWIDGPLVDNPASPFPSLEGQLAALTRSSAGIQLVTINDVVRTASADHAVVIDPHRSREIRLAGTTATGLVLVHDLGDPARLAAYDPITLLHKGTVDLPGAAISVWNEGDHLVWIDVAGQLHADGTVVPGSYVWVHR
ncbi:MAG: hypothetical protein ACRDZZ_12155, partial [Ilumatobacteraceae bacterium]